MHRRDVGEAEFRRGRLDPFHSTPLRVDQSEGSCRIGKGKWESGQAGARSKVGPVLLWLRLPDRRQSKRVVQVPLPETFLLSWA